VSANGKPSLIDGRHVGMAGKTNFFLVATEDGTDNDYNYNDGHCGTCL
jgi:hypothetical protein